MKTVPEGIRRRRCRRHVKEPPLAPAALAASAAAILEWASTSGFPAFLETTLKKTNAQEVFEGDMFTILRIVLNAVIFLDTEHRFL
jgi:hypothetical protein